MYSVITLRGDSHLVLVRAKSHQQYVRKGNHQISAVRTKKPGVYSSRLRQLVHRCIDPNPDARPTQLELLDATRRGLRLADLRDGVDQGLGTVLMGGRHLLAKLAGRRGGLLASGAELLAQQSRRFPAFVSPLQEEQPDDEIGCEQKGRDPQENSYNIQNAPKNRQSAAMVAPS